MCRLEALVLGAANFYTECMMSSRRPKIGAHLKDALLGLVIFIAVAWMITANQASERPPDAIAYFWAFGLGALLLVRRTYPLIVLWVTVVTLVAYYMSGYPAVGLSIPTAAAFLNAAEFRRVRWPIITAVALLAVSYGVRITQGQDLSVIIGYELAGEVGLMAASIALGVSLRLYRQLQHSTAALVESTTREERSKASATQAAERADIARDLHDSLGHQITIVSMYADIARQTVAEDLRMAQDALDVVSTTSSEMLTELRQTVKTLRGRQPTRTVTTLVELETEVIEPMPLDIHTDIDPQIAEILLSASVQTTIYRVVQESLTNVLRHSAAKTATLEIHLAAGMVAVAVSDPGPARDDAKPSGACAGIDGMTERVKLLGGWLTARGEADGFIVQAALPVKLQ